MRVLIGVGTHDLGEGRGRRVTWVGEVDWPSVPPEGATWVHCGGWPGEPVWRVYWCGPGDDDGGSSVQVEVRATPGVVEHLVAGHGFTDV